MSVPETEGLTATDTENTERAQRNTLCNLCVLCVCGGEVSLAYSTLNRNRYSKSYQKWHKSTQNQLYGVKPTQTIQSITLTFYPSTRRKSDLTNKAESVMDLLVDCKIIPDDNWFEVPKVVLLFGGVDKLYPRVEISIV